LHFFAQKNMQDYKEDSDNQHSFLVDANMISALRDFSGNLYSIIHNRSARASTLKDSDRFVANILSRHDQSRIPLLHLSDIQVNSHGCHLIVGFMQQQGYTRFKGLDVSRNRLGDLGAKIIADFITNNHSLLMLNVASNDISPKGMQLLLQALGTTSLRSLDLGNSFLSAMSCGKNRLNAKNARDLATALRSNRSLTELKLAALGSGVAALIDLDLWGSSPLTAPLIHLDLPGNFLDDSHVARLCRSVQNSQLTHLSLAKTPLLPWYAPRDPPIGLTDGHLATPAAAGDTNFQPHDGLAHTRTGGPRQAADITGLAAKGASALIALLACGQLHELDLSNSGLDTRGYFMSGLCLTLARHSTLKSLRLDVNPLSNTGCVLVARALFAEGCLLASLSLVSCGITDISALAGALAVNGQLRSLSLAGNQFGDRGVVALCMGLSGRPHCFPPVNIYSLIYLDHKYHHIGATGLPEL
jgi:hypothetical protein